MDDDNLPPGVTLLDLDNHTQVCEAYQDGNGLWQCERCQIHDWSEEPYNCENMS